MDMKTFYDDDFMRTHGLKPVKPHLQKYVDAINNTGLVPLDSEIFDEDFEPVGPQVRAEMYREGLIDYGENRRAFSPSSPTESKFILRPDLKESK